MLVKIGTYFDGELWCARGIGEGMFTRGGSLDELYENMREAVALHFGDTTEPITVLTLSEMRLSDADDFTDQRAS